MIKFEFSGFCNMFLVWYLLSLAAWILYIQSCVDIEIKFLFGRNLSFVLVLFRYFNIYYLLILTFKLFTCQNYHLPLQCYPMMKVDSLIFISELKEHVCSSIFFSIIIIFMQERWKRIPTCTQCHEHHNQSV